MKTLKTYRNAALILLAAFTLMSMISPCTPATGVYTDADRAEFAGAGYWIDPVVVSPNSDDALDGTGYWIDPVIVTWNAKNEFAHAGYWIEPVVVTCNPVSPAAEPLILASSSTEEFSQLNAPGYWIDPVIVTCCVANTNEAANSSRNIAMK